jgi:hypothetical protein
MIAVPESRLVWLQTISQHSISINYPEEAGITKIVIAAMVMKYLEIYGELPSNSVSNISLTISFYIYSFFISSFKISYFLSK